jgi:hypothetical protein
MIEHDQQVHPLRGRLLRRYAGSLEEMTNLHQSLYVVEILAPRGVQREGLTVSREFEPAAPLVGHVRQRSEHRSQVPPLEISRDGVLKDCVVGALMGAEHLVIHEFLL